MNTHPDVKRPLDDTEMDYLLGLDRWDTRLVALFRCLLGAETYDRAEIVQGTRVQIPKRQWVDLAGVNGADGALNWMNKGPSAYDDWDAPR